MTGGFGNGEATVTTLVIVSTRLVDGMTRSRL